MNIVPQNQNNNQESPFDQIRRFTEDGQEYWLAREVMPLLGYKRFDKFCDSISRAKLSCENSGEPVTGHFLPHLEKKGRGRSKQDFKLTRYACYLIAMNGDARKPEISLAQQYFVVQTIRAERVIPEKSDRIKELEIQLEIARQTAIANVASKESKELDHAMLTIHGAPTVLALRGKVDQLIPVKQETIEVIDERHDIKYSGQTLVQIKNYLNKTHGFNIKSGAEVERILDAIGESGAIGSIPRTVLAKYIPEESLEECVPKIIEYLQQNRQLLLGE